MRMMPTCWIHESTCVCPSQFHFLLLSYFCSCQYQIILLTDRCIHVWATCPELCEIEWRQHPTSSLQEFPVSHQAFCYDQITRVDAHISFVNKLVYSLLHSACVFLEATATLSTRHRRLLMTLSRPWISLISEACTSELARYRHSCRPYLAIYRSACPSLSMVQWRH